MPKTKTITIPLEADRQTIEKALQSLINGRIYTGSYNNDALSLRLKGSNQEVNGQLLFNNSTYTLRLSCAKYSKRTLIAVAAFGLVCLALTITFTNFGLLGNITLNIILPILIPFLLIAGILQYLFISNVAYLGAGKYLDTIQKDIETEIIRLR